MTPQQRGWEDFRRGWRLNPYGQTKEGKQWQNGWNRASKGYNKPQPEFKK